MTLIIWFLTALMIFDCIVLIFLVLLQLPKKEAGAGLAFGGAATDALFGAGSGNVLTKTTKWVAGAFFVLALLLAVLGTHPKKSGAKALQETITQKGSAPATIPTTAPASSNNLLPSVPASNIATKPATPVISKPVTPTAPAAPATSPAAPSSTPKK